MVHFPKEIEHSEKYTDDFFEYKHVILPKEIYEKMPRGRLLSEAEWRSPGSNPVPRVDTLHNLQARASYTPFQEAIGY
jgi:hypothetical protein